MLSIQLGLLKSAAFRSPNGKNWIEEYGSDVAIRKTLAFSRNWGRTLVSSSLSDCVVEYDETGKETWRVSLKDPMECWALETGERIVRCWEYDPFSPKHLIVYAAGDGEPRELWSLSSKCRARPTLSGDILVWGGNSVWLYDRLGRKLWETEVAWDGKKRRPLEVCELGNGNFQVAFSNVFVAGPQYADTAIEIDGDGQVVGELPFNSLLSHLQTLPNGNALIRVDQENGRIGNKLEERDHAGNIVWVWKSDSPIRSAQRLPDGRTLVGDSSSIKLIDRDGSVAWQMQVPVVCDECFRY